MQSYLNFAERIETAASGVLGNSTGAHLIRGWCDHFRQQCETIQNSRGVSIASIAIVGAKGQGKTWIAKQLVLDPHIADLLPSGVLSSEATTQLYWIGPVAPESLDSEREVYLPCKRESLVDLNVPYLLLDTPGLSDDNVQAASIAREAMSLSPVKLLVVRRDQLRAAILGALALDTEGAICVPIVTCVPTDDLELVDRHSSEYQPKANLRADLDLLEQTLRGIAPGTKFQTPILVEDFEATGDETGCGLRLRSNFQNRLGTESIEQIAATRSNRLEAAKERLRSKVSNYVHENLGGLAQAVKTIHREAEALPSQTLETVLGSKEELHAAIRGRMRASILTETGLIWFPYRTLLSVLSFTTGAWDRLILSLTGSVPSIFGTFFAWAKNISSSRNMQRELQEGIRERLNREIEDRLQPIQDAFYRQVHRSGGGIAKSDVESKLRMRLTGVDELQVRARKTFEWCVDRELPARWFMQLEGLLGTVLFWGMMSGPIVAIYRKYFYASWHSLVEAKDSVVEFEASPGIMFHSILLSTLPLLLFCMLVLSWLQRAKKVRRIGIATMAAEHRLLEELRSEGVLRLHYEDPLLEQAEFLVKL